MRNPATKQPHDDLCRPQRETWSCQCCPVLDGDDRNYVDEAYGVLPGKGVASRSGS